MAYVMTYEAFIPSTLGLIKVIICAFEYKDLLDFFPFILPLQAASIRASPPSGVA